MQNPCKPRVSAPYCDRNFTKCSGVSVRFLSAEKGPMRRARVVWSDREQRAPSQLYFLETQCAERHIKIGIAGHVGSRIASIQGNCPYRISLIKRVPGAAGMERELHSRFASDRLYGEWFRRSADLMALIESLDGLTEIEPPLAPVKDTIDFDDMVRAWKANVA